MKEVEAKLMALGLDMKKDKTKLVVERNKVDEDRKKMKEEEEEESRMSFSVFQRLLMNRSLAKVNNSKGEASQCISRKTRGRAQLNFFVGPIIDV